MRRTFAIRWAFVLVAGALLLSPLSARAGQHSVLGIKDKISKIRQATKDARQKASLQHAEEEVEAAQQAIDEGKEKEAVKHKKKALQWVTWAAKECADVGTIPSDLGGSLRDEGAMTKAGVEELRSLFDLLKKAKKQKKKSDFPIEQEMAIKQLVNAILQHIDTGGAEIRTPTALNWYLNAAAACDDVEELIKDLLDYLKKNGTLPTHAHRMAKKMIDRLYQMKEDGRSAEDIMHYVQQIKQFLREAYQFAAHERLREEQRKAQEEQATAAAAGSTPVTVVRFTALDGRTNVNKSFVGEVQNIRFVALDGADVPPKDVGADFSDHAGGISLDLGDAKRIRTIIVAGTAGVVRLFQDGEAGKAPTAGALTAKDGTVNVRNGVLSETFNVSGGVIEMGLDPQDHRMSIGGVSGSLVASRANQLGAVARGVRDAPGGGVEVKVVSPSGATAGGTCAAWGYDITAPPVTRTNVAVAISVRVFGLGPGRKVRFEFVPGPGQKIAPRTVTVLAAEAVTATPVAKLTATLTGPQSFGAIVQPEKD